MVRRILKFLETIIFGIAWIIGFIVGFFKGFIIGLYKGFTDNKDLRMGLTNAGINTGTTEEKIQMINDITNFVNGEDSQND